MNTTISNFIRTIKDDFPEIFTTDKILVTDQSNGAAFVLKFIRLSIDSFEKSIETTRNNRSIISTLYDACFLTSFQDQLDDEDLIS